MTAAERKPLTFGYLSIIVALVGIVGLFVTAASTGAVVLFAAGLAGVVISTAALAGAESRSRPGPVSGRT